MEIVLLVLLVGLVSHGSKAQTCNGQVEYCDLRFNQITLPGSHAAGSGFNGSVRNCQGEVSGSSDCIFRNQNLSIANQLNKGVRFLSLDVCVLNVSCNISEFGDLSASRLVSCQGSTMDQSRSDYRYGGRVMDILQQVDDWMRINTNEVIGLHFTSNIPPGDFEQAGQMIAVLLEQKWGEGASIQSPDILPATEMSNFFTTNENTWPSLRQAIDDNQRIFILFDQELVQGNLSSRAWLHSPPYFTVKPSIWEPSCTHLTRAENDSFCSDTNSDIVILSAFTLAVCLHFGQENCNKILMNASDICYNFRRMEGKALNVILVDFVQINMGQPGSVFEVASELNLRNIREFVMQGTEYSAVTNQTSTSSASLTAKLYNHFMLWWLIVCISLHTVAS